MAKTLKIKKIRSSSVKTRLTSNVRSRITSGRFLLILLLSGTIILFVLLITAISKRIYIAKVNGQSISRLEYYKELENKYGNTVVDDLITKSIIYQEAKKNGISVTSSDVQSELSIIRNTVTKQGSTLEDVLAYQGITYDQLLENIKIQKILEQLLKNNINISDEEIRTRYDENKDIYGKDKTFDQLKDDIRYQLYQEKITTAYRNWIEEKRSASVIEKYI